MNPSRPNFLTPGKEASPRSLHLLTAAVVVLGSLAAGCARVESVGASGIAFDKATYDLVSGALKFANGSYGAGCVARSGSWSVPIDGYAGAMTNPALSVVMDNTACVLTLTSLRADATYAASPTFALTGSNQSTASAFAASSSPTAFYANAKLSAVSFAADFSVGIIYSDDPALATGDSTSGYTVSSGTATSSAVPAPDYAIDMTSFSMQTNVNNLVQSTAGTAELSDGAQVGEGYVVLSADPGSSYAELHSAYSAATPTAISGANPTIAAVAFTLVGVDLSTDTDAGVDPAKRYIIIAHTVSGVSSFQLITVTFHPHG
jgi:hypothetical protein